MYYHENNGRMLSALGFGGLRFSMLDDGSGRIDQEKAKAAVAEAMRAGINVFDTAHSYNNGGSEETLGAVLSEYPRDSYYLSTKFYAAYSSDIEGMFAEQLKRCRTGYFDFYMLHSLDENLIDEYMDEGRGYLKFLRRQKEEGRIRSIGFSSHAGPETLEKFLSWDDGFDMALIQLNYIDWDLMRAAEQYRVLTEHSIPVWVMEPLKGGNLVTLNREAREILKEAAPDRSAASWGMRWLMGLPGVQVVLSGMSDPGQVRDNAETFARPDPLTDEEQRVLARASAAFLKDRTVPCSACRYCVPFCPRNLDIPLLIRGRNECCISGETWRLAELSSAAGPEQCAGCGNCLNHCPQKIAIPGVMAEFAEMRRR